MHLYKKYGRLAFEIILEQFYLMLSIMKLLFSRKKLIILHNQGIERCNVGVAAQLAVYLSLVLCSALFYHVNSEYNSYKAGFLHKERHLDTVKKQNDQLDNKITKLLTHISDLNSYLAYMAKQTSKVVSIPKQEKYEKIVQDTDNIIKEIDQKVTEKISKIEGLMEATGYDLKSVFFGGKISPSIGGPIPVDDKAVPEQFIEFKQNIDYLNQITELIRYYPIRSPIIDYRITSGYGHRVNPITRKKIMHRGIDLAGEYNSPIFAVADGTVKYARRKGAYGLFVEISHNNLGFKTRYGHLRKLNVKYGEKVRAGKIIGWQGNTGRSTGEHLHYEILYNNKHVNPYKLLKFNDKARELEYDL